MPCRLIMARGQDGPLLRPRGRDHNRCPRCAIHSAGGYHVDQSDIDLEELVALGKSQGYLTYDQVNEYLPDEAVNPDKLDSLLVALDDLGISLFNEPPEADVAGHGREPSDASRSASAALRMDEDVRLPRKRRASSRWMTRSRWNEDPVRMYLTQMAEIPLLTREQEISLAKKIEVTAQAFPPHRAGVQLRHAGHDQYAGQRSRRQSALRSYDQGLAHRAVDQRADHGPHAAQPEDARAFAARKSRRLPRA